MAVTKLTMRRVAKPWGRYALWPGFDDVMNCEEPVGEIWFQMPDGREQSLLIKYLFTNENLSIQVHPGDEEARAAGYPCGKDEAWVVLDADPTATIAIGTRTVMSRDELRAAALDGSIEDCVLWKSVKAGDVFYSPAGTIHAIGKGLTLVEVQTNVDLTYRLWDYKRPRELHLEQAVAAARPVPYVAPHVSQCLTEGRCVLCDGPKFILERWSMSGAGRLSPGPGRPVWIAPVKGGGSLGKEKLSAGEVWLADEQVTLALRPESEILIAYPGNDVVPGLWAPD